jgi:hypothetical protein
MVLLALFNPSYTGRVLQMGLYYDMTGVLLRRGRD